MCDDFDAGGVVGVIVQCITGLDGQSFTWQQLTKAQERGKRLAGYAWAFRKSSVATRLAMFDPFHLEWLGLDVEDTSVSIASVDRDLALCDDYMGVRGSTEFYTGRRFFQTMGWLGLTRWCKRSLWDAIYDDNPDPQVDFVPFGGWTTCRTKQFWAKQVYGGV
ncbi:MAG: hypothetical protein J2P17_14585, partial [Mycobacterium sp.]|nr:hypothetical protein [Mycobacterium sp.]